MTRVVLGLGVALVTLACESEYDSQCQKVCYGPEFNEGLVRSLRNNGHDVNPGTVCDRVEFAEASDCNECRDAFSDVYGVEPIGNPDEGAD